MDGNLPANANNMNPAIETTDLTRDFGTFRAVNHLNLRVEAGRFYGFLGPNGAGKSTTVKMFTGLLAPSDGEIEVCGLDPRTNPIELKRHIGVLPEDLRLFDDLTVEEHLQLTASVYGLGKQDAKERIAQ